MGDAPERIWAWSFNTWSESWGGYARQDNLAPMDEKERSTGAEYIRADLHQAAIDRADADLKAKSADMEELRARSVATIEDMLATIKRAEADKAAAVEAMRQAAYKNGVAHARLTVASHMDWNPSTIRDDLLLNIDMTCTGCTLPAPMTAQCCMCGKKGLSTVEGDGGTECELPDGRWTCSRECWDRATEPMPATQAARVPEVAGSFRGSRDQLCNALLEMLVREQRQMQQAILSAAISALEAKP